MPRSHLARLGPAWIFAALLLCVAIAAMAWPLVKQAEAPPAPVTQPAPSGAALFAALTAGQTALFQDDLQAIAQLVRGLDPEASDAVAPLKERLDALLRREEQAAAAAAPPMVLAQFAASVDGAAVALAKGAVPSTARLDIVAPVAALVAALVALLATPLAVLRGGAGAAAAEERQGEIATRFDHGVRSVVAEMAMLRGDVTQVRQSLAQASTASERLASVAEIVGDRVVQTALDIERTSEQTAELPQRILEQAEMLSEVSRRGKEAATLLVRLIDDAAERDGMERDRIERLADAVVTIRTETERCVGGIRPLLSSLETIAALPASLEATIDRAAVAASDRAATAGMEAFIARTQGSLVPLLARTLDEANTRCGEAFAAGEAQVRASLGTAVSETVAVAEARLASSAAEVAAAVQARIDAAATSLAERADARLAASAERLDAALQPLGDIAREAGETTMTLAGLRAELAAEAAARPGLIDHLVSGVREQLNAGFARDLHPLAEALSTTVKACQPLPEVLPALASAAAHIAEGAARHTTAISRLDDAIGRLATYGDAMPDPALLIALADRLSGDVAAFAELRNDIPGLVQHLGPSIGRMEGLAATIDATVQSSSAASGAVADAAARLGNASRAIEDAARELAAAPFAPPAVAPAQGGVAEGEERQGSIAGAILSGLDADAGERSAFAAIRSALTEIDVVQDAVARLAREAEALAEDVASRRLASLPEPVQQHLPELLATIDATIGRLHSAATAIAYATDGQPERDVA